jgi:hypothetical protein
MTHFDRIDIKLRLQPTPDSHLGQTIAYLRSRGYDLSKEVENLLIARFLPFALKDQADPQTASDMACDCMGKLAGFTHAIEICYQLQPSMPPTINEPSAIPLPEPSDGREVQKQPHHPIQDQFLRMFGE